VSGTAANGAATLPVLVAIETATETVGVAVRTAEGVEVEFALTGSRRHVETLTPALEDLLARVGLEPTDLGLVAVDVGPGLFTGLRVGVAAAKALAQSLQIPVIGATSLDILSHAAAEAGHHGPVLSCVDARRGEVFASLREVDAGGSVGEEHIAGGLFAPDELVAALHEHGGHGILAVGDGARRYAEVLATFDGLEVVGPGLWFPPPACLLRLALARVGQGESPVAPTDVVPLYMREADARINFAKATRA
jgi:tRNA threonylcarbamoyladenosine biosynthesis protein TsaB